MINLMSFLSWLTLSQLDILVVSLVLLVMSLVKFRASPWRNLPPGPPGLPLLGNLLELREKKWLKFAMWKNTYGPIMHINVAGQPVIVLSSLKIAADLLDRRAVMYSDRPQHIISDIMSGGHFFFLTGDNNVWKRMRKGAAEALKKTVIRKHHQPALLNEAVLVACGMIENPLLWTDHFRRATTSSIVSIVYGKEPLNSVKEPIIESLQGFVKRFATAAKLGAHLVEVFPWMKYLPARFTAWKRFAISSYEIYHNFFHDLYETVAKEMPNERPSVCATLINEIGDHLSETENVWTAATIALGGDAVTEFLSWWLLAMIAYPEVQKRAQKEIDDLVGRDRLPSFADYEKLPYIRAMVKEVLRWNSVAPLGIPHRTTQDNWYSGYFIPKHATILANVWAINRDPQIYGPDAGHFNPARHLDNQGRLAPAPADTKEEGHVAFGFGRRICVGRHIANDSLFIVIAVLLWALDFECPTGEDGNPVPLHLDGSDEDGLVIRPIPFGCKVTPRFSDVTAMLDRMKEEFDLKNDTPG